MFPRRSLLIAATLGAACAIVLEAPHDARADAARSVGSSAPAALPAELMAGLAQHASHFEEMKRRGAFTMTGRMEQLDGDGRASNIKEITLRSTPTPTPLDRITNVIRFTENGEDKTGDAQRRVAERRAKRLGDPDQQAEARKRDLKLPFLATEQSRYVFTLVERDAVSPSHVRVAFSPKIPAENAIKGSAWVDEKERCVLSVGFSLSKNPTFIDHIDVTVVFGLATDLGRAPSTLTFDARGGFLIIRRHYRGTAVLSQPATAF